MTRDTVKSEYAVMMSKGIRPIIEYATSAGHFEIEIGHDKYGVYFLYEFSDTDDYDSRKPFFDGCIQKRHGMHYVSFAEIDRMGYNLDRVLQLIDNNVRDGILSAFGIVYE